MTKTAEELASKFYSARHLYSERELADLMQAALAQARREALNQTEKALLKARGVLPSRREALSFINMNEIICALDCIEDALALIPQEKACKGGEET